MIKLDRIATKTGDKGQTSLGDGKRVSKSSLRIDAIGDVDELNAFLGWSCLQQTDSKVQELLRDIQNDLFDMGADLCIPQDDKAKLAMSSKQVERLEGIIATYNKNQPPLTSFLVPGSMNTQEGSLHIVRTVCRRAERSLVALENAETLNPLILVYINRLSDLLFIMIRATSAPHVLWAQGKNT